jgi:hypothetical protein
VDGVSGELLRRLLGALLGKWLVGEFFVSILTTRTTVVFVGEIYFVVEFLVAVADLPPSDGLRGRSGEEVFQKGGHIFHHPYTGMDGMY